MFCLIWILFDLVFWVFNMISVYDGELLWILLFWMLMLKMIELSVFVWLFMMVTRVVLNIYFMLVVDIDLFWVLCLFVLVDDVVVIDDIVVGICD